MEKRQQILEAAERVFRAKGLAGATTREIARDAGCAEGTLYLHFEDRMALFSAVLDECLPDVTEALDQLESVVGEGTVRKNLENVALRLLTFYGRAQGIFCSIFAEPELLRTHRQKLNAQSRGPQISQALLASYIRSEQRIGRLNRRISPETTASLIMGACFYRVFVSLYMDIPVTQEPEMFVREMIGSLMRGMKKSTAARQAERANALVEVSSLHS